MDIYQLISLILLGLSIVCFISYFMIQHRDFLRNFPHDYEAIISSNDIKDQSETLIAMSRSYSFIGANSSYSWWAAYLNKSDKLKAIFPATWYKEPGFPCQQMLEDKWIALPISDFHNE